MGVRDNSPNRMKGPLYQKCNPFVINVECGKSKLWLNPSPWSPRSLHRKTVIRSRLEKPPRFGCGEENKSFLFSIFFSSAYHAFLRILRNGGCDRAWSVLVYVIGITCNFPMEIKHCRSITHSPGTWQTMGIVSACVSCIGKNEPVDNVAFWRIFGSDLMDWRRDESSLATELVEKQYRGEKSENLKKSRKSESGACASFVRKWCCDMLWTWKKCEDLENASAWLDIFFGLYFELIVGCVIRLRQDGMLR